MTLPSGIFRTFGPAVAAAILLVTPVRSEDQCGTPAPTLADLRAFARTAAIAERVAPHRAHRTPDPTAALLEARLGLAPRDAVPARASEDSSGFGWQPGFGLPVLDEYAAVAVEFRGELVVSGWLHAAGSQQVRGIARWTASGWQPLGEGVVPAFALAVMGDRLYAGEWVGPVKVWDGTSWYDLPASPFDRLEALAVHDGRLVAAGSFQNLGRVATFDGVSWTVLGADFSDPVDALASYRGALYAGGRFTHAGAAPAGYVARWTGATWEGVGSGIDPAEYAGVSAMEVFDDRLIVGGWFVGCGGISTPGLAAWDGAAWKALPGAPGAFVEDLHVQDGRLFMAGRFDGAWSAVAEWNGATWKETAGGVGQFVLGLGTFQGRLTAVGGFDAVGNCPETKRVLGVAVLGDAGWDGLERWDANMHGLACNIGAALVEKVAVYRGDLVVSGMFRLAGSPSGWKAMSGLARWGAAGWEPIGENISCVSVVAAIGDDLIAGGWLFGYSDEGSITGVARWDGTRWHRMGQGLSGFMVTLAGYGGRVYAGGELTVNATGEATTLAMWDGTEWSAVPGAPSAARWNTPRVSALLAQDGLLVVGGNFTGAGGIPSAGVAAWDGSTWRGFGSGMDGNVEALASYRGELFAGGWTSLEDGVSEGLSRWDGEAWHGMGLEYCQVTALVNYGDRLIVGGLQNVDRFAPGSIGIVAWDGLKWSGFGTGLAGYPRSMVQHGGDLFVGGTFSRAGEHPSFSVARWGGTASAPPDEPILPDGARHALVLRSALVASGPARIAYALPAAGRARLEVFDVRGARVATLMDRELAAGSAVFDWADGSPAGFPGAGVYFLRLTSGGRTASARIVFAR